MRKNRSIDNIINTTRGRKRETMQQKKKKIMENEKQNKKKISSNVLVDTKMERINHANYRSQKHNVGWKKQVVQQNIQDDDVIWVWIIYLNEHYLRVNDDNEYLKT